MLRDQRSAHGEIWQGLVIGGRFHKIHECASPGAIREALKRTIAHAALHAISGEKQERRKAGKVRNEAGDQAKAVPTRDVILQMSGCGEDRSVRLDHPPGPGGAVLLSCAPVLGKWQLK
ncbi:hypothetical protein AAFF_G00095390 [Aldrovandia affinis]|uniref:Uncharacterized protein n=1 Tax=Aldrovandia affinis TaxID=143900 RepID=A0AAD7WBS1_9TELE|nr:hypothetical protein AAFF_G00095390 [Aldrovandia affinis]